MIAGSSSIFLIHGKEEVVFMSCTINLLISNWPRTREISQLSGRQGSCFWPFSQRSRVGHALRPIFMLWLVKIWQVSSCVKNLWSILKLVLIAETNRVLCNLVMFLTVVFPGCTKWNTAARKILKLFMAGLFIGFLVEKCAACQSHRSRMDRFYSLPLA